jgi:hypothetical protein
MYPNRPHERVNPHHVCYLTDLIREGLRTFSAKALSIPLNASDSRASFPLTEKLLHERIFYTIPHSKTRFVLDFDGTNETIFIRLTGSSFEQILLTHNIVGCYTSSTPLCPGTTHRQDKHRRTMKTRHINRWRTFGFQLCVRAK